LLHLVGFFFVNYPYILPKSNDSEAKVYITHFSQFSFRIEM